MYSDNQKYLDAWKNSQTGYEIIDSAMIELKETGYIHNRLRMLTASFLVKNLHINWLNGADYFMEVLLDGDEVINAFNWQWVAGIGFDHMPYFTIFNPELQAKRYDPQGEYRKKWQTKKVSKIINFQESKNIFLNKVIIK